MRLSKLKLMNYRCFGSEEQIILIDNLTTFIGNNSAGKTAALSALNCMFSENSGDRILQRSDFHSENFAPASRYLHPCLKQSHTSYLPLQPR